MTRHLISACRPPGQRLRRSGQARALSVHERESHVKATPSRNHT